jgi:hypothetical protein
MDSKILGSAGCVCDNAAAVTAAMLRDIQTLLPVPEAQYFHGKEFLRSSCFREVTVELGSQLPTFWDNLSVPSSRVKQS